MRTWFRRTICGGLLVAFDAYIDEAADQVVKANHLDGGEHICGEGI